MSFNRLEQVTIEDKYSRHNIRAKVLEDIEGANLTTMVKHGVKLVNTYLSKTYYQSKEERIAEYCFVCPLTTEELVLEILVSILPIRGIQTIQSVVGRIAKQLNMDDLYDSIKTAAELIAVVCGTNAYNIIAAKDSETGSLMLKSNWSLEESTLDYISNMQYLPPMICKPNKIRKNSDCGYLTKKESIILGKENHHNEYQALDVVNISNNILLELDKGTMKLVERSKKPLDTIEKENNYNRMVNASRRVYSELRAFGNQFRLTWKYDMRGRFYSQGFHVNIQSTSYKKSLINLAKKELITGV